MNGKNFYQEKLNEIRSLIQDNKFSEAFVQIQVELNMPYIPMIYEQEFKDLNELVKSKLITDSNNIMTLSRGEVIQLLLSDDEELQVIALELIDQHNLRTEASSLKYRIETWEEKDLLKKAFLMEIMIDQKIDIEIKFSGLLKINPSKSKSTLANDQVLEMFKRIDELTIQNPSLSQAAQQEAKRFLLLTYPNSPKDGNALAGLLVNVTMHMFGQKVDLSADELLIYKVINTNAI